MIKTITKLGAAALLALGLSSSQAQTYIPNTTFGGLGSGLNQFKGPDGITLAPDGKIWVADNSNHRISVWTQSGNTFGNLTTFGGFGSGLNQFVRPYGVTVPMAKYLWQTMLTTASVYGRKVAIPLAILLPLEAKAQV